ncbi:MAG: hypothetical protein GC186_05845 [Rhodobacteraceae bacterium]|nr:hypothetical protein [Paracoccaceae bacterium]
MNKKAFAGLCATALFLAAGMASADTYIRKGNQDISVVVTDGKLFCTRVSDGFEMCNGMLKQPDGTWKGGHMKHPDMPGFMRFNGTVTFTPTDKPTGLTIQGCALGICQSEAWPKKS